MSKHKSTLTVINKIYHYKVEEGDMLELVGKWDDQLLEEEVFNRTYKLNGEPQLIDKGWVEEPKYLAFKNKSKRTLRVTQDGATLFLLPPGTGVGNYVLNKDTYIDIAEGEELEDEEFPKVYVWVVGN